MKFNVAIILLSLQATSAFMSSERLNRASVMQRSMAVDKEVDLSIPYDAAARLAYDEWREQFNKGEFDAKRYASFKANYEAVTVANVVAKKEARESGSEEPIALMTLNEYGDFTEQEFQQLSGSNSATGKVLEKALEVAQSQSEASSALEEAANALAAEEEVGIRELVFLFDTTRLGFSNGVELYLC